MPSFGGFLGIGESYLPLPLRSLAYDPGQGEFIIDLDRSRLESARRAIHGGDLMAVSVSTTCRTDRKRVPDIECHLKIQRDLPAASYFRSIPFIS